MLGAYVGLSVILRPRALFWEPLPEAWRWSGRFGDGTRVLEKVSFAASSANDDTLGLPCFSVTWPS